MKEVGFEIEVGVVGILMVFIVIYGSGKLVVGIFVEYDVLLGVF